MIEPPIPGDEEFRLAALRALPLLDTPRDADFDAIVQLGQALFDVPTCLVTLVDDKRQWFKARIGLDVPETSRAVSFCGHAILQRDVFVVLDASRDDRFHDNPLVIDAPFIRFYAGAPILLPSGYTVGTVCIFGPEPRAGFDAAQRQLLARLAELALAAITVRALRDDLDQTRLDSERQQAALAAAPVPLALADGEGRISFHNDAFAALCQDRAAPGVPLAEALGLPGDAWPPQAIRDGGVSAMLTPPGSAGQLAVHRDAEGFVVTAATG